MHKNN